MSAALAIAPTPVSPAPLHPGQGGSTARDKAHVLAELRRHIAQVAPMRPLPVGLPTGVYQFFRPSQDVIAQADILINGLNDHGGLLPGDLPPVIDVEEQAPEEKEETTFDLAKYVVSFTLSEEEQEAFSNLGEEKLSKEHRSIQGFIKEFVALCERKLDEARDEVAYYP